MYSSVHLVIESFPNSELLKCCSYDINTLDLENLRQILLLSLEELVFLSFFGNFLDISSNASVMIFTNLNLCLGLKSCKIHINSSWIYLTGTLDVTFTSDSHLTCTEMYEFYSLSPRKLSDLLYLLWIDIFNVFWDQHFLLLKDVNISWCWHAFDIGVIISTGGVVNWHCSCIITQW